MNWRRSPFCSTPSVAGTRAIGHLARRSRPRDHGNHSWCHACDRPIVERRALPPSRGSDSGTTLLCCARSSSPAGTPRTGTRALASERIRARAGRRRLLAGSHGFRPDRRPASGEKEVSRARSFFGPASALAGYDRPGQTREPIGVSVLLRVPGLPCRCAASQSWPSRTTLAPRRTSPPSCPPCPANG